MILETKGIKQRLELVLDFLQRESQAMRVSSQISESIQKSRDQEMRLVCPACLQGLFVILKETTCFGQMALQRQAQEA